MKAIIFDNIKQFNELENKIQEALFIGVPNYTADRWALPFYSLDGSKIALDVQATGERKIILDGIIKGFDIAEIERTDPFWFNQEILKVEIK